MRYSLSLLALLSCFSLAHADGVNRHGSNHKAPTPEPIRALITFTFGWDWAMASDTETVLLLTSDPYPDRFVSNDQTSSVPMGGIFVGAEFPFESKPYRLQSGFSYYTASPYEAAGIDYFYSIPSMGNKEYSYSITSQRIFFENKFLYEIPSIYGSTQNIFVYLSAAAGAAINRAYNYQETAIDPNTTATGAFASNTVYSFAYSVGAGIEAQLGKTIRLGLGYRFNDLGEVSLGDYSDANTSNTIDTDNTYVNEAVLQLSTFF